MFIVKTVSSSTIRTHYCHSIYIARIVKNYIQNKYSTGMEIKEVDGLLHYDPGGCLLLDPFFKQIELKNIQCRNDHLDILLETFENKNFDFSKRFCRITSMYGNLCYSKKEINEIKKYIKTNKSDLDRIVQSVYDFWENRHK